MKLFLASHGKLASGMKSSLDILLGESNNLTVFDAYLDEKTVKEVLDEFLENIKDGEQVILLSDLYGGSVNQVMYTYLNRPNIKLISGVNLAILLELSVRKEAVTDNEILSIIEESKESMKLVEFEVEGELVVDDFFD